MDYSEALEFMMKHLPMFSRVGPVAFKKDLSNTLKLCEYLGHPQNYFQSIHVAGTNGKGSVSHIIAGVLTAHGYTTGLYTSPHYKDFCERIKVGGALIPQEYVASFISRHMEFLLHLQPSYFEMAVGMAFRYFADTGVEWAVIETGLGGRLDSTNIVEPRLSIITNISYDHTDILGETLGEIAMEKAGIIKNKIPICIGEYQEEIIHIFEEKAKSTQSQLYLAEELFTVNIHNKKFGGMELGIIEKKSGKSQVVFTDLYGTFQLKNIQTALAGLYILNERQAIQLNDSLTISSLKNVRKDMKLYGRMQWLSTQPPILADSAHNEAGMTSLLEEIENLPYRHIHIVLGLVKDKNPDKILRLLPSDRATYYFTNAKIPRALMASDLQLIANRYGLRGLAYDTVESAYRAATTHAALNEIVLICGSIFVVSEIL